MSGTDEIKDKVSRFTHVDPFEDTERQQPTDNASSSRRFTHVDPFEDTERKSSPESQGNTSGCFTHVDPFEDTESDVVAFNTEVEPQGFTHVDPFEDTERRHRREQQRGGLNVSPTSIRSRILKVGQKGLFCTADYTFHPRRSVRGY